LQTFVIVPVKRLDMAKSRLSTILTPNERRELALAMLTDVIQASIEAKSVDKVIVVSSDNLALRYVEGLGAHAMLDMGGLNAAVKRAMEWCAKHGATATLTIPLDLPLLKPMDIDGIVNLLGERRGVVLCPSTDGGTNALLCSPPNIIEPHFGPKSFHKHMLEASKRGVPCLIYNSPRVSLDIDTPMDFKRLVIGKVGAHTRMYLRRLGR